MKQHQPLYLKYRPQKLDEVIGQDVVTKTLTNAISYNKIVHAYLFCGPRGTGKTSSARILAKSLNCESGVTITPCGKCNSCESITRGNSLDVIEIDAASHRKVEDAEDLINRVSLGTYGSRYKIYIIDEVHMLTDHAFNALLKTIEEPPKNVIFILATTEEYKVIPTIISRCQKLDFKTVSQGGIENRISNIANIEKININKSIISFISKRANGCLRDAVSLLDQISVLQTDNNEINPEEVFELFGTIDRNSLLKLAEAVLNFDIKQSIDLAEELVKSGKDISELFKSFVELMIDLGKAKLSNNYKETLSQELSSDLKVLDFININHLLKIVTHFQDSQAKLRFAISQELQFVVDIMSIADKDFLISLSDLQARIEKLEKGEQLNTKAEKIETKKEDDAEKNIITAEIPKSETCYTPQTTQTHSLNTDLDSIWKQIIGLIESNPTKTLLNQSGSYVISLTEDLIEIGITKDTFLPRLEKDAKKKEMIIQAIKAACNKEPKDIRFRVMPRQKEELTIQTNDTLTDSEIQFNPPPHPNPIIKEQSSSLDDDDFTRAVKDLLGAKKAD